MARGLAVSPGLKDDWARSRGLLPQRLVVEPDANVTHAIGDLGLTGPVRYAKTGGSANLSVGSASGIVSLAAAIDPWIVQRIEGTATDDDGEVRDWTVILTGQPGLTTFALDGSSLPSALGFARASTALYRDGTGQFLSAANGVPALTHGYAGGAWVRSGLYLTPAFTNLALYAFKVGSQWLNASSATAAAAPSLGLLDDGLVIASAGSSAARYQQAATKGTTVSSGATYTVECWFRFGSSGKARLFVTDAGGAQSYIAVTTAGFDTKAHAAGTVNFSGMEDMGDGLYRCWFSYVPTSAGEVRIGIGPNISVVGQTIVAYGCNVVAGDRAPDQPVPTSAASATKAAATLAATGDYVAGRPYTVRLSFADGAQQDHNVLAGSGIVAIPNDIDHPILRTVEVSALRPPVLSALSGTTSDITDPVTGLISRTQSPGKSWSVRQAANYQRVYFEFEVRPGDVWPGDENNRERNEITLFTGNSNRALPWDADCWFAGWFAVQMDGVIPDLDRHITVLQIHDIPDSGDAQPNPPLKLELWPDGRLHVMTVSQPIANPSVPAYAIERGSFPISVTDPSGAKRFHHLVARVNMSRSCGASLMFWLDGALVFDGSTGCPIGTNDVGASYWKCGNYVSDASGLPGVIRTVTWASIDARVGVDMSAQIAAPVSIYCRRWRRRDLRSGRVEVTSSLSKVMRVPHRDAHDHFFPISARNRA